MIHTLNMETAVFQLYVRVATASDLVHQQRHVLLTWFTSSFQSLMMESSFVAESW